jgi:flagellar basal-body rod modification protein FlgD
MITTKQGTKTWADPGKAEVNLKQDIPQTQLTVDQKKMLNAEDLGSVLNKVADPNYVDTSKRVRGTGNKEMDKDAFFKLMMAQLKNQDPTNPLKNHEMAAQLAQFSTLEQMTNVNSTLKEMKAGAKPIEQFQALNLIGKQVSGDSSKVARVETDKEHDFVFNLPQDAKQTEIKVMNSKGDVIREFSFNELKSGENRVTWNGQTSDGRKAPKGDYFFQTESLTADGQKIAIKTNFEGVISGMSFSNEGPILQVGKQSIRLKDIRQFTDPGLMSNDQKSKDITMLDLKNSSKKVETDIKEETKTAAEKKAAVLATDDVLSDVQMSGDLLENLKQEAVKLAEKNSEPVNLSTEPSTETGTL